MNAYNKKTNEVLIYFRHFIKNYFNVTHYSALLAV